jgi:hypothetical protein
VSVDGVTGQASCPITWWLFVPEAFFIRQGWPKAMNLFHEARSRPLIGTTVVRAGSSVSTST